MLLERTHSNRWIVRARRLAPPLARITQLQQGGRQVLFRTEVWCWDREQRVLLRDCDALEVALALVIAHVARGCGRVLDNPRVEDPGQVAA